jgi:fructose-1,6-bisphosphatase/inositol monophosphatase family enzyme
VNGVDTTAVLRLMQDVAEEVINPRFRSLQEEQIEEKNPGDLVTIADHESEALLTKALQEAYPDAVVLGEEAEATDPDLIARFSAADHGFTVDPVDGTKNFVHGSPDHAVMIGEMRDGVVVRGWIWQPQHQAAYVAERGAGAWLNGERLTLTAGGGSPYRTARRKWVGRELGDLGTLELTWACCGVDYPHLVAGDSRANLYNHSKPWDHLPGALILTEAGGHIGMVDGSPFDPRRLGPGLVCAPDKDTYDEVVAAVPSLR